MFEKWDNISKVALIYFFSSLYFYLPVLTIYYQQRGLSFLQIGTLWGVTTITIFLSEIPTGLFADKFGRKASVIMAMAFQLLGEILFLFANNYLFFIFIQVIAGLGFAFQSGCIQALVYDFLKDQNRESEMKKIWGSINSLGQAGFIVGALASSFIVSYPTRSRIILAIVFTIVSVSAALIVSLFLKEPLKEYHHGEKSPIKMFKESLAIIKNSPLIRKVILFGLFTTPFLAYLNTFQPPYFALSKTPLSWLGITRAIAGVIAILCLQYAYKLEHRFKEKGVLIATIIPAILYFLMVIILHPLISAMLFVLNYSSQRLQEPLLADYYNIHLQSEVRATTLSAINMLSSLYIAVMGVIFGKLADISLPLTFFIMGIIIFFGSIMFRLSRSHIQG